MESMTEHRPHAQPNDYLPAAGRDLFLPGYDLLTRVMGMASAYDELLEQADLTDGWRVLEIGCGTGNVTLRAKRLQPEAEMIGLDPDPRALALAQRKAKGLTGIRFEQGYSQHLPFADGEFDCVLSSMMLHHLDEQTKKATAVEALRVLRPGGSLHILDIGGRMTAADGFMARRLLRGDHVKGNVGDAIPRLLAEAGFECNETASRRHRFVGRLTFYRAARPAT